MLIEEDQKDKFESEIYSIEKVKENNEFFYK